MQTPSTRARPRNRGREVREKLLTLYSEAAEAYEDLWAPELLPLSRELLAELPLEQARMVLEGGAGVGSLLPELRTRAPEAVIVAADLSYGMLKLASPDFPRAVMDASVLAINDASFGEVRRWHDHRPAARQRGRCGPAFSPDRERAPHPILRSRLRIPVFASEQLRVDQPRFGRLDVARSGAQRWACSPARQPAL